MGTMDETRCRCGYKLVNPTHLAESYLLQPDEELHTFSVCVKRIPKVPEAPRRMSDDEKFALVRGGRCMHSAQSWFIGEDDRIHCEDCGS